MIEDKFTVTEFDLLLARKFAEALQDDMVAEYLRSVLAGVTMVLLFMDNDKLTQTIAEKIAVSTAEAKSHIAKLRAEVTH